MEYKSEIPDDFPQVGLTSSITGFQPKLPTVKYGDQYYLPGNTPPERQEQWSICNELVDGYAIKCRESKEGKHAHMTHAELLSGYYKAALKANYYIDVIQIKWIFKKVAERLGWPPPEE